MNSNMYSNTLDNAWRLFESYLDGQHDALLVIVSSLPLNDQAVRALQSSFTQLGYGMAACTFVTLKNDEGAVSLSGQELFLLLESLDPFLVVIADAQAAEVFSQAYREPVEFEKKRRIFGREIRAFESFESLLESSPGKQKAWAQLKTLPKLEN